MAFKHFWVQYKLGKISDQAYIKAETFVIGRAPECDLPIPTDVLSRRHLKVYLEEDRIFIKDLGSTNGTFLEGEQLEPNEKYEYQTGNKLYLDANKECVLRITAIYQRDIVDPELEARNAELEKKRAELRSKRSSSRGFGTTNASPNFVANASESVDNIFENLIFITKQARFNKEKQIREAENRSQEMLEKAKEKIETQRSLLEKELLALQVKTRNEANRVINEANEKSRDLVLRAESKARKIREKADVIKQEAAKKGEEKKKEIIKAAEEKHGQIIADAYLQNKKLVEENKKIDEEMHGRREQRLLLEKEIEILKKTFTEHEKLTLESKKSYSDELEKLNSMRGKVENMERRNRDALDVLDEKIPKLEQRASDLNKIISESEVNIRKNETELDRTKKSITEHKKKLETCEEKSLIAEKRLEELNKKVSEIDNSLKRHKEKVEKEIEVNLANAKEKALNMVREAEKEAKAILMDAKEDSSLQLAEAKKESEKIVRDTQTAQSELQGRIDAELKKAKEEADAIYNKADEYHRKIKSEADEYSKRVKKEADDHRKMYKEEAEKYGDRIRQEALEYQKTVHQDADDYDITTRKKADFYQQDRLNKADAYYEKTKKEADEYSTDVRSKVDADVAERRRNLELEVQEAKDKVIVEAEIDAKTLKDMSKQEADTLIESAQKEAKRILSEVKGKASQDLESLQKQIDERKRETDEEIQAIRTHAVQKMEEQKQQLAHEEEERNRIRVLKLRKELNNVLRARISPFLKDVEKIDRVDEIINRSINAIMLDEVYDESFDAENYSDIDPSLEQNRAKRFWTVAGGAVIALLLVWTFKGSILDSVKETGRTVAAQNEKAELEKIEQAQKANDLSAQFNPEMKEEFLPTYTERVMYTKDYLKLEKDVGFQSQWRIELEGFFVDKLRLSENRMVPFFSREKVLIHELGEARETINGNFVDEGKKRLDEIEADFYKRLKKQEGYTQKQIDEIMVFKKEFFEKNKDLFTY